VFADPRLSSRWLVKRVGDTHPSGHGGIFEACSDNPRAVGAADSHEFGWVSAGNSYRVLWAARAPRRSGGVNASGQDDQGEDAEKHQGDDAAAE
jgi:hypothetical protein